MKATTFRFVLALLLGLCVTFGDGPAQSTRRQGVTSEQQSQLNKRDEMNRRAERMRAEGRFAEALVSARQALVLTREIRGPKHADLAEALARVAELCEFSGQWKEAVEECKKALTLRQHLHGPKDWRTANARLALAFAEKALALEKRDRDRLTGALQKVLQVIQLDSKGKHGDVERLALEVLQVYEAVLGREAAKAAQMWYVIGRARWLSQKDLKGAIQANEKAMAIFRKTLPDDHPDLARCLNNLGFALEQAGNLKSARPCLEEAVSISRKSLADEPLFTALGLTNLGLLQRRLGDFQGAKKSLEEALVIRRSALPVADPLIEASLLNLGRVQSDLQETAAAMKSIQEALEIRKKILRRKTEADAAAALAKAQQQPTLIPQLGHSGFLMSVAVSADAKWLVSGGWDKTARLWEVATSKEVRAFRGHAAIINSVSLSGDGKWLATGSDDQTARLWEVATGKEVFTVRHSLKVGSVVLSGDGKWLVTAGDAKTRLSQLFLGKAIGKQFMGGDGLVKWLVSGKHATPHLWDIATGKQVRAFHGRDISIASMSLSSDSKWLATGGIAPHPDEQAKNDDVIRIVGSARLWEVATGKEVRAFPHSDPVSSVALSGDGKWLATTDLGTVCVWEATTGKKVRTLEPLYQVNAIALSADGKFLATCSNDQAARLWEVATGKEVRAFRGHVATGLLGLISVSLSHDGKWLVTGSDDKTARLWEVATGKEVRAFRGHAHKVTSVSLSSDSKWLAAGSADKTARLWEPAVGKVRAFPHSGAGSSVLLSADGRWLVTGSHDHTDRLWELNTDTARLWDVASGTEARVFRHPKVITRATLSADGKWLVTGGPGGGLLWEVGTGKKLRAFTGGSTSMSLSGDGRWLGTAEERSAALWDAATGKRVREFQPHADEDEMSCVSLSADGKLLVTAAYGKPAKNIWGLMSMARVLGDRDRTSTAHLWEAATGKELRAFRGHFDRINSMTLSSDGKWLVTGSDDRTARLWEAATGKEVRTFRHAGNVSAVSLSGDGERLLTGSDDGTVRLWDVKTGREVCAFVGGPDGGIALTPDNYYMASRGALEAVAFRVGNRAFGFDQFDLKFNRPDKVLERIGQASKEIIAAYRHAYLKRLKRMNFTENMLNDDFHLPEIAVNAGASLVTREYTVKLKVQAGDSKYLLDRLHVDVNGVPVHGTAGISLRKQASKTWEQEFDLELSAGKNKIDVSVLNEKGAESLRETRLLQYDAPARKPNLYIVAVGVSDYQDARFRLTYADKDARDLALLFESKRDRFGKVNILRILNREVTRENILNAKAFLKGSQVDDLVIVFFAGHGLLDGKLDYYFATADIDFKNPAQRGLPYEDIEVLLEGGRARKKLLLMDTCHSGELDKDEVQLVTSAKQPEGEIKIRTFRGLDLLIRPKVGLRNSYQLMQEMFADLRRGTGAVVIASAGGAEFALESASWKNGVFTHALLRGFRGEADRNKDGRVQVSELRDFVEKEVRRLTNGRQVPTSRRENLVVDFTFD